MLSSLQSNSSKKISYLISFIDHALVFYKSFNDLVMHSRQYLENTHESFTLTIAEERLYIVFASNDIFAIYRNNTILEFNTHVQDLFKSFDESTNEIKKLRMFYHSTETKSKKSNLLIDFDTLSSSQNSVELYIRQSYKQHLQSENKLDILEIKLIQSLTKSLDAIREQCVSRVAVGLGCPKETRPNPIDCLELREGVSPNDRDKKSCPNSRPNRFPISVSSAG